MDTVEQIDVFVSYSAADRERVRPLVDAIQDSGFNVWWDTRIAPGAGFDSEIQDALDSAKCVLVVWSNHSIRSEWVITEASEGLEKGILVPVTIDDVRPPLAFRRRQTIAVEGDDNAFEHVVAVVQGVLSGEAVEIRREEPSQESRRTYLLSAGISIGLILGLVGGFALTNVFLKQPKSSQGPLVRASIDLDGYIEWQSTDPNPSLAMSPDGSTVVFSSVREDGNRSLFGRRMDRQETFEISGADGGERPFFSPDGRWVGFFEGDLIMRVPLEGGTPNLVTELETKACCRGASWGDQDVIVFVDGRSGLKAAPVTGGAHRKISELDLSSGEGSHRTPSHVGGHPAVLFSVYFNESTTHQVWVLDTDKNERRYLLDGLRPRYVESGYLVYARREGLSEGSLWAAPFDPETLTITGPSKLVQSGVAGREGAAYAVGTSGPIVYMPSQGELVGELALLNESGSVRVIDHGPMFEQPQFSNDGEMIAVGVSEIGKKSAVRIYELDSGAYREFAEGGQPLWGLDDAFIVYNQTGEGLIRKEISSPKEPEVIVRHSSFAVPNAWVDQGRTLVYNAASPERIGDVFALTLGGETRHIDGGGATLSSVAPNEKWIAICTWPKGIVVGTFPHMESRTIASATGCSPKWSSDGTKLYMQNRNKVLASDVTVGRSLAFGATKTIADLGNLGFRRQYDVDRRGRLALARHYNGAPKPAVVMMNWPVVLE